MTRQVVLDTETTGLDVTAGHRLIEIGAIELIERRPGRQFHEYLNPDRTIDSGAREVTGISDGFLKDKPRFADLADDFLAFIEGSELIIHNAPFDVGFLDAELEWMGARGNVAEYASVLDTLVMAREQYPGQRNSLDALCKRLDVDNRDRELHGGLLDARLLADVYLAMTSGQSALELGSAGGTNKPAEQTAVRSYQLSRRPLVQRADTEDLAAHEKRLDRLDDVTSGTCLWRQWDSVEPE